MINGAPLVAISFANNVAPSITIASSGHAVVVSSVVTISMSSHGTAKLQGSPLLSRAARTSNSVSLKHPVESLSVSVHIPGVLNNSPSKKVSAVGSVSATPLGDVKVISNNLSNGGVAIMETPVNKLSQVA